MQFYEPPNLGKKISTTWNVLKSEVYLACINFWKFHDDLKVCLEVIRLPSWPENVKFSGKMQFFMYLTPWKICFWINDKFEIYFFWNWTWKWSHSPKTYIFIQVFKLLMVPWKCSKSHFVLKFSRKNPINGNKIWTACAMLLKCLEFSILNETIKWWISQGF